jgi:hypothetical protein
MATGAKTALFGRAIPGGIVSIEDQNITTGDRFFVHSGTGESTNSGTSPTDALTTIDAAINKCTASVGDVIYVMPGHAETIAAAGIDVDVIGLSIIGLGKGDNRPTITFNATTSDADIDADDIYISGLRFISSVNNLAWFIDANSNNLEMEDCQFVTASATEAYNFINIATTKDYFTFRRCSFIQPTDPEGTDGGDNTGCFYFVDSQYILVEDCYFEGNFETSIFHNKTTAATNLWIKDCYGSQALSGADVLTLVDNGTGGMVRCAFDVPSATDATTEGLFVTIAATTTFGFHNTTFMNDNAAGGNNALPVTADMA